MIAHVRSTRRLGLLTALTALVLAAFAAPPASAADCPRVSFLEHGGYVYRSYGIPASVTLAPSTSLGQGMVDAPGSSDACRRVRREVDVERYAGIDPLVAVAVADRPSLVFVLGNKCFGYQGPTIWSCLKDPLTFQGKTYVGTAYPPTPAPRKRLPLGASLGPATLAGQPVNVVRIDGVDPAIAVGIEGRPSEAFLVPGVCPYEGFSNSITFDDLRRCLTGPVWVVFDPPGAIPGREVTAHADRALQPGEKIQIALAFGSTNARPDILPRNLAGKTALGTLSSGPDGSARIVFDVPKVAAGGYEAVATCPACAADHGGRIVFPAGTFIIGQTGSSSTKFVLIAIALAFLGLLVAALFVRRKGWTGRGGPRRRRLIG